MEKIRICGDEKHPPFEFINEDNEAVGFNVDITKCIANEMGIEVDIELLPWSDAIWKFEEKKFDAVQGMSISGDREEKYFFGAEYVTVFHSAFILSDTKNISSIGELREYKVAVQENDVGIEIVKKNSKDIILENMKVVPSQDEALKLLLTKHVDIVVGNKQTILYYINQLGIDKKVKLIGNPLNITKYGIAFNHGDAKLAYKFSVGMNRIKKNGKYEVIYNKWFTQEIGYFGQQILENVKTGVIVIDKLGRVSSINNYGMKFLGLARKDVQFKSFYETKISEIFNIHIIQKILNRLKDTYYSKVEFELSDKTYYIEVNYLKLTDEKNDFMGVLINFKDITEKTKLEQTLIRKDKMESLGFLLLNVAHEIRNPLTSIKNFIELIPSNIEDADFRESLLFHVPKQIEYIDNLVSDLLEYSKPKAGRIEKNAVKQIIKDEIIPSFSKSDPYKHKINFKLEIPEEFFINADKNQLKQILINVIQNACESIQEKGTINVYTFENGKEKRIIVENDGGNIPESVLDKIYDPFFTTKEQGTGLGLFISYQLLNENNGTIEISNIEKGVRVSLVFAAELENPKENAYSRNIENY